MELSISYLLNFLQNASRQKATYSLPFCIIVHLYNFLPNIIINDFLQFINDFTKYIKCVMAKSNSQQTEKYTKHIKTKSHISKTLDRKCGLIYTCIV